MLVLWLRKARRPQGTNWITSVQLRRPCFYALVTLTVVGTVLMIVDWLVFPPGDLEQLNEMLSFYASPCALLVFVVTLLRSSSLVATQDGFFFLGIFVPWENVQEITFDGLFLTIRHPNTRHLLSPWRRKTQLPSYIWRVNDSTRDELLAVRDSCSP
jgi:uncharacterized membrane protein YobD (UPF0266 family)